MQYAKALKRRVKLFGMGVVGVGTAGYAYDRIFATGMRRYSHFDREFGEKNLQRV